MKLQAVLSQYRWNSHEIRRVSDLAIFGKTIANGIPMGAIIGKKYNAVR